MKKTNDKKNVLFRADGNSVIGLGHIYRSVAIAERIKNFYNCYFAIQNPSFEIIKLIRQNFELFILPEDINFQNEKTHLINIIFSQINPAIIVFDGYNFDFKYQQAIKECGIKIIYISDDQTFNYPADVIINHAEFNIDPVNTNSESKIYTGYKYALLRKPFIELRKSQRQIDKIENLFICFGGADSNNITIKALNAAIKTNLFKQINVVVAGTAINAETLDQYIALQKNIKLFRDINVNEMIALMKSCELAVVPASTIAMECVSSGMLLLTGLTAQNQELILNGLEKLVSVKSIGSFLKISESDLAFQLKNLVHTFKGNLTPAFFSSTDPLIEIFKSLE